MSELYRYDNCVLFYPILPSISKFLTIIEKSLETVEWTQEVVMKPVSLFRTEVRNGKEIGITFQGFWKDIVTLYIKNGTIPKIHDCRISTTRKDFPEPNLEAMYGFRFSQKELLISGITQNSSGIIGAPTRFGKTALLINTLRAYKGLNTLVTAPGVDLIKQLYKDIQEQCKDREVTLLGGGSKKQYPGEDITVVSADSLHKIDPGFPELILIDEPHAFVTSGRIKYIDGFTKARRLAFGATLKGRFDGGDKKIIGVFGPVLAERTYRDAVLEGAICPLEVIFVEVKVSTKKHFATRVGAYNNLLFNNKEMGILTSRICKEVIPEDFQTLIFIRTEEQADLYKSVMGDNVEIAMAKKMTPDVRTAITAGLVANEIKRCLCSKIFVQGVTFHEVRVLINCEAGGNNTSAIQKPGRLAEVRPGKKCGIVIDFMFVPDTGSVSSHSKNAITALCRDSKSRLKAYTDKGYGIHHVKSVADLKETFNLLIQ